jgi:hypothetical protein
LLFLKKVSTVSFVEKGDKLFKYNVSDGTGGRGRGGNIIFISFTISSFG